MDVDHPSAYAALLTPLTNFIAETSVYQKEGVALAAELEAIGSTSTSATLAKLKESGLKDFKARSAKWGVKGDDLRARLISITTAAMVAMDPSEDDPQGVIPEGEFDEFKALLEKASKQSIAPKTAQALVKQFTKTTDLPIKNAEALVAAAEKLESDKKKKLEEDAKKAAAPKAAPAAVAKSAKVVPTTEEITQLAKTTASTVELNPPVIVGPSGGQVLSADFVSSNFSNFTKLLKALAEQNATLALELKASAARQAEMQASLRQLEKRKIETPAAAVEADAQPAKKQKK